MSKFEPLFPAEEKLLDSSAIGDRLTLGDGGLPMPDASDVEIRAELIRHLLLASDAKAPLHAKGIRIRGAKITGILDMQGCECEHDLTLTRCLFEKTPSFLNARMRGLHLSGCHCPGLIADNASFAGSIYLRQGFVSTGEISMPSARIGGDLQICDARLASSGAVSLFAASARVEGSVYLGDYPYDDTLTTLDAQGALVFASAVVGQDFYLKNCAISPNDNMANRPMFFAGEEVDELTALSLARADIGGVLFMKGNQVTRGVVNLAGARARRLNDEPTGEYATYRMRLDGFVYQDFSQEADTTIKSRLEWLERRPRSIEFSAQPYEQLARVLHDIGHRDDARHALMRKEQLQRADRMGRLRTNGQDLWKIPFMFIWDRFLRYLIGYGYRPAGAVLWGVVLIAALAFYFQKAWDAGDMAPNAAPILISKDWIAATQSHPENPAKFWSDREQAGKDYETFNAVAYAADLVIPIVNLGQEGAWAPSTSRSPWGWHGWWIRWVAKIFGWVITALGAAAITGVIRSD